MKFFNRIICCIVLAILSCFMEAQGQGANSASARDFVQRFYSWYVPQALSERHGPASDLALRYKGSEFSPNLLQALKEDSDAQAKANGDIVGLDFDPFLNTQDPCERYELGKVSQTGSNYSVEVYGVCSGKKNAKPDVVAEVGRRGSHWEFVNFHYPNLMKDCPNSADLLAMLKVLREQRLKP